MRNLIRTIFVGVLIGIAILMLSYLGIYYIEGQDVFEKEILQLAQGTVLQNQLIVVAFYGSLFATVMSIVTKLVENKNKTSYKPILGCILFVIVGCILIFLLNYMGQFSENIKSMIIISTVLVLAVYPIVKCVTIFIEQFIINKKIKEKNAQEIEKGNS